MEIPGGASETELQLCYLRHGELAKCVRNLERGPAVPLLIRSDGRGVTVWRYVRAAPSPFRLPDVAAGQRCSRRTMACPTTPVSPRHPAPRTPPVPAATDGGHH